MPLIWQVKSTPFSIDHFGGVGKHAKFFSIHHDSMVPIDQKEKLRLTSHLPGLKSQLGHFNTVEEAQERAEKAWQVWLKAANLEEKQV